MAQKAQESTIGQSLALGASYDDVMYWVDDPGSTSADRKISQRVEWTAGRRTRVANNGKSNDKKSRESPASKSPAGDDIRRVRDKLGRKIGIR
jgi:hypothetical protein